MRRRDFVTAVPVAFLSGCLNDETDGDREDGAEGGGGDGRDAVEVYESLVARIPPEGNDIVAEFKTNGLTASGFGWVACLTEDGDEEGPPLVRTAQVNTGDEAETYELAALPPHTHRAENGNGDVLNAVPTERHDLADGSPEVRRDDGAWYLAGEDDALPESVELEPGTGYVGEYALVSEDGELSEGEFTFGDFGASEPATAGFRVATWDDESPGPSEESRFEPGSLPDEADGTALSFYHDADESTEVYLTPSKEVVELAEGTEEIEFILTNRSEESTDTLDASFDLYKLVDGGWRPVTTSLGSRLGEYETVWSRKRTTKTVRLFHDKEEKETRDDAGTAGEFSYRDDLDGDGREDDFVIGPVGGGKYAYDPDATVGETRPAAVFRVEAPPVDVIPPEDASAETDVDEVVVTADGETEESFVVRADEGHDEVVAPEALYGVEESLRYALPFFDEDVKTVEVRADTRTVEEALSSEERRLRYRGSDYRVTR